MKIIFVRNSSSFKGGRSLYNVWMRKIPTSAITIVEWSEGRCFIYQVGCTLQ